MAREIMAYSKSTNVSGADGILTKIKTFALAQGWTIEYDESDVSWLYNDDVPGSEFYEWAAPDAGDPLFDRVIGYKSTGYGSQDLCFRFYVQDYDGSSDRIHMNGIIPGSTNIDDQLATPPHGQNRFNYSSYGYMSMPNSTFPELLLVGNKKRICVHARVNSLITLFFWFGTPEMFHPEYVGETELSFMQHSQTTSSYEWYEVVSSAESTTYYPPYYIWDRAYYMDGSSNQTDNLLPFQRYTANQQLFADWCDRGSLLVANAYSGFRTIVPSPLFRKHPVSDEYRNIGWVPSYLLYYQGLNWGDIVTRGTDQWIVVPHFFSTDWLGHGYKIA